MRKLSLFRQIRLDAQKDAAAERDLQAHKESIRKEAAEKKAKEKVRKDAEVEENERLIELARRKKESLQLPRRIMMWQENSARSEISFEALKEILSIQSQMFAAFFVLIDKKVPLLAPGARLSAAEEDYASRTFFSKRRRSTPLPVMNQSVQRRSNSIVPNMLSKKCVSFNSENTVVVLNRSSTPSLRR